VPFGNGCATIQNNGLGIGATQGATVNLRARQGAPGAVQILNNAIGVAVTVGSQIALRGPILIQGNTVDGVRLRNASGSISGGFDGPIGPTIQQNGTSAADTAAFCCALAAGISLANNSTLDISSGSITNNSAPGILIQDNSSIRIIGSLGSLSITQ